MQSSQGAFDQTRQFVCSTVNGLVKRAGMGRDGQRAITLKTRFHHAAFVVLTDFVIARRTVFIAQVHFNARDAFAERSQSVFHDAAHVSGQGFIAFDGAVGINLDVHTVFLMKMLGRVD